jgi:hypothetical protein
MTPRRPYGTGSLFARGKKWVGQWRADGRLVKRTIGPIREPGSRDGLTKRAVRPASAAGPRPARPRGPG